MPFIKDISEPACAGGLLLTYLTFPVPRFARAYNRYINSRIPYKMCWFEIILIFVHRRNFLSFLIIFYHIYLYFSIGNYHLFRIVKMQYFSLFQSFLFSTYSLIIRTKLEANNKIHPTN